MIDVSAIIDLHHDTVSLWHRQEVTNSYEGFLHAVCEQHKFNYLLWHEEDIARSPNVGDVRIAEVKRAIDKYNQQRNDWIEKLDDALIVMLREHGVMLSPDATQNTETPGSAIDRLSILSLRLYHMLEQLDRTDTTTEHKDKVQGRLVTINEQRHDLSNSLEELVDDIFAGRKRLKVYRQFKMYNDPTLNPYLYDSAGIKPLT